ncbi:hypothetical protein LCM27_01800 [Ruegeria marisrubri]|uniref:hypothetical protein n=1 Tax=Ruegeria marisrubri TaxID=1685379 RepID=UPI001CD2736A|nr:hypothetical protein [Ruegeria marisrubri]MCA0905126.1 hypothetical protein [Ruegeria marisrubri]
MNDNGTLILKRGDTSPSLAWQVDVAPGQTWVGANAKFRLRHKNGGQFLIDEDGVIDTQNNTLTYNWSIGDTDNDGEYLADFQVTFADQSKETFPSDGFIRVKIGPSL